MTQPNQEHQDENPNPTTSNIGKETHAEINEGDNSHYTPPQNRKKPNIYKVVAVFFKNEKNQSKVANLISLGMLVVTFLLFIYTYRLYRTAAEDSKTARQSAKAADNSATIAQRTLDTTRKYYLFSLIKQQKAIDDNNTSSQLAFDRANKSLTLQDSSLKETQKEFEIENKPLVQILDFKFDTLEVNKKVKISFDFVNYGKQPVKCLVNKYAIEYSFIKNFKIPKNPNWNTESLNSYLSGQGMSHGFWKSSMVIDKKSLESILDGSANTFIFGSLIFQNTVTFKKSIYKYNYRLSYNDAGFGVDGIEDTTINIK